MSRKFLRKDSYRFSKFGKRRKKMLKWRRPKGRDNKMREKIFGHPASPTVGYRGPRKESGRINGLVPLLVHNMQDIEKANKNNIIIIGKIGAKKKFEVIKKANEMKLKLLNVRQEIQNAVK